MKKEDEYRHQEFVSGLQKNIDFAQAENRDLLRKKKLLEAEFDALRLGLASHLKKVAKRLEDDRFYDEEIPF